MNEWIQFQFMTTDKFKADILPYYKEMYKVAVSIMGSDIDAADAVQDAMLRLWDKRAMLKDVSSLKSYCLNVVRNICLNSLIRRKAPPDSDKPTDLVSDEDIHRAIEWRDTSNFVVKAMSQLPLDQQKVLQLSAFGGLTNSEIANLLGTSQGNVRVILSRARNRIKQILSKQT
jgi:RNA polymerase sigma factor, sigma-70 family